MIGVVVLCCVVWYVGLVCCLCLFDVVVCLFSMILRFIVCMFMLWCSSVVSFRFARMLLLFEFCVCVCFLACFTVVLLLFACVRLVV